MCENDIAKIIFEACLKIHRTLGPGLLESAYEACLLYELEKRGLRALRQVPVPLVYESVRVEVGFRLDLLVEDKVVVELKAVDELHPVHAAQVITYLKAGDFKLGLLINFNAPLLKDGFKRFVNGL